MTRYLTRRAMLGLVSLAGAALSINARALGDARPYSAHVLAKRPVGYWRFDETGGIIAHDASGQARNGTYKGGFTLGQPGALQSERDFAVGLDGRNGFIEVPDSDAFSQPTSGQGLTVEVWVRPDTLVFSGQTDQHYIHWLGKGQPGAYEWGFRFYSQDSPTRPNRISAYIWNPTSAPGVSNEGAGAYFQDELQPRQWIHVVACYDPGDASDPNAGVWIYKNGVLRAGPKKSRGARYASYNIHSVHGSAPVRFGTRDLGSFLAGGLDEIAIYPRVLSASEIMDNYAGAL
jgi:hypothetical protein